jgi:hypothetical protein
MNAKQFKKVLVAFEDCWMPKKKKKKKKKNERSE